MLKKMGIVAGLAIMVVTGCSSSQDVNADDPVFAGIDHKVAREVLASSAVRQRIQGDDEATMKMHLQGIALNFVLCRQAYGAYRQWITTGRQPSLPPAVRVQHPIRAAYSQYRRDRQMFSEELASGDIDVLRSHLLNDTGCGVWIPAKPGDQSGPTIADAVRGS